MHSKKSLSNNSYITNPKNWTCSCPVYLTDHFLLCKHLVQSVHPLSPHFFNEVKCHRSSPFWKHKDLIPLVNRLKPIEEIDEKLYEYDENMNDINDKMVEETSEVVENET
ncbi:4852_t:CDS:2 [Cetraspora pellucida]|uniref:4852_t:CDS:1 n=1 Tax=Cetraspora pellucida TaxID=1433469 RepID=A0ACA9KMM1_9GLOM|nr:4852_t:CDS:2 [Cetraspora pellucida]